MIWIFTCLPSIRFWLSLEISVGRYMPSYVLVYSDLTSKVIRFKYTWYTYILCVIRSLTVCIIISLKWRFGFHSFIVTTCVVACTPRLALSNNNINNVMLYLVFAVGMVSAGVWMISVDVSPTYFMQYHYYRSFSKMIIFGHFLPSGYEVMFTHTRICIRCNFKNTNAKMSNLDFFRTT